MALSSDKFSLLFYEISKEFRLFEDILLTCGLFYAVKTSVSLCFSAYNGFREHIWAKIHRVDLPNTVGKWAVISGVSQGPGKAFAVELAKRGMNIILLDDNSEWLHCVSTELEQEYSVAVEPVLVNFVDGFIYDNKQLQALISTLDIGILVNSYQIGLVPSHFDSLGVDRIKSYVMANVFSASALINLILPGMLNRDKGIILNFTTLPGIIPVPLFATYSSTKAYVQALTNCLQLELRGTNVHACSVTHGISRPDIMATTDSPLLYLCPTTQTWVRNTVDALTVSSKISGGFLPAIQVWMIKGIPFSVYKYFAYGLIAAFYIRRGY